MSFISCPLPAELQTIPLTDCPVDFGQFVRALIARKTATPLFAPGSGTPAITQAAMTTLLTATGNAKGILTPLFASLTLPETEVIIEGENDNSTEFGAGHLVGGNIVRLKPMFTSISDLTAEAMWGLNGEKNLQIIYFNEFNQALIKKTGYGFDIYNQTMADVTSEGHNKKNKTPFSYTKRYGWSRGYRLIDLPFDVLSLVQVAP